MKYLIRVLSVAAAFVAAGHRVAAEDASGRPLLHGLFTDNMVLQRGIAAPVWGWDAPGTEVTIKFDGKTVHAKADANGKWLARLAQHDAGGPFTVTVKGSTRETLRNVMIGDVWICSGQSNMEMGIGAINAPDDITGANHPNIRLFTVPKRVSTRPEENVDGRWQECTPETVAAGGWGGFTAVGYFFGKNLHEELNVPIGLIHTSWGGTVAEAWTSAEALMRMDDFAPAVGAFQEAATGSSEDRSVVVERWYERFDPGSKPGTSWGAAGYPSSAWKSVDLPGAWESGPIGEFDGIVWFRKTVELPAGMAGRELMLHLGPIDDRDTVYFNGTRIGGKENWLAPRDYTIAAGLAKAGSNTIAIRVLDTGGAGGLVGRPEDMEIEGGGNSVSLAGTWRYAVSVSTSDFGSAPPTLEASNPNVVTVLYNGMLAPLVPYAITGAIWYQGESNASRARQYRELLPTMIDDWRGRFGVGNFPFLIVQLANFMATRPEPAESQWAELREAQSMTADRLPNTGIAVAIDIGEADDIHPKNKQEVGRRLALGALAIEYGRDIEYSGPVYKSMRIENGRAVLTFDHVGGGLVVKGGDLKGFSIAGQDGRFVWADARIDGDSVVVSSRSVRKPTAVRYAWADNPVCNLYNRDGLPASPFRTDSD